MAITTPVAITASGAVGGAQGGTLLYGWNFTETAGSTAEIEFKDGGSGGTIIVDCKLASGQSTGEAYVHPIRCSSSSGLYCTVVSGTVRGAAYIVTADR